MSTDSDDPKRDDPKEDDDRRVGEMLADGSMAPETMARLAAWFGPQQPVAEPTWTPPVGWGVVEESPERVRRRAQALAAVEAEMIDAIEERGRRCSSIVGNAKPLKQRVDPSIALFDFRAWRLQMAGEPSEVERPEDIWDALKERAPQALLRDLHRPEIAVPPVIMEQQWICERGGLLTAQSIRNSIRASYQIRIDQERRRYGARQIIHEELTELRSRLDEPWEDSLPDNPRPVASERGESDWRWFGGGGVDPTQ